MNAESNAAEIPSPETELAPERPLVDALDQAEIAPSTPEQHSVPETEVAENPGSEPGQHSESATAEEEAPAADHEEQVEETIEPAADEAALPDSTEDDLVEEGEDADDDDDDEDEDDEEDTTGYHYMQNRELSWLTFDERVLDQGADESVPLLERLNFISIFWSNLREFFMVRVGSLTDLSFIEPPVIDSKTGMTPDEQIRAIHERCHELYPIQESTYEHLRGQLAKEGVRHLRPDDLSDEQRNYLFGLVKHNIEPFLSPQIINARHPFPHLENGKLYILVRLDDDLGREEPKKGKKKDKKGKKKDKGGADGVVLGLIPLPHQCERVIKLPGRGFQFILLEHAIEMCVPEIFSMYKIKHTNVICVTRNADIDANQGFDEQDEDYREHMSRLLKQRARLAPVRLECERPLSPIMEKHMLKKLDLKRFQVYDTIVPLDLGFTWGLGSRLSDSKRERLSNPPFAPAWPTCFDRKRRIMDQVVEHDVLLSYPYESMDPFVQLLREAANDPDVIKIKITLYRLASQSHLAEALIAAADAGKEVTALFELRARFDEYNNIEWSKRFEQAGCNVLYGFRDYKVHSKICCITRRLPDGSIQHITQLGTGNYNEKTAKLYTDFSFITIDERFGADAVEFFRNMQLENVSDAYKTICVAPLQIKKVLMENLDKQIERARAGLPAFAFMKANSVTDKAIIEKISEASNAGVKITLFIRGICCLVPHVTGATENVRVVSIVGRLLEHSRVYCFGPKEDCVVYLSSADLMTRNLNKRIEIAWPLPEGEIRDKVVHYINVCMRDTAKLRELRPNATYTPLGAFCDLDEEGNPEPSFDAQTALIKEAADQAAEAAAAAQAAEEAEAEAAARAAAEAEAKAAAEAEAAAAAAAAEAEAKAAAEAEAKAAAEAEAAAAEEEAVAEEEAAAAAEAEAKSATEAEAEVEAAAEEEAVAEAEAATAAEAETAVAEEEAVAALAAEEAEAAAQIAAEDEAAAEAEAAAAEQQAATIAQQTQRLAPVTADQQVATPAQQTQRIAPVNIEENAPDGDSVSTSDRVSELIAQLSSAPISSMSTQEQPVQSFVPREEQGIFDDLATSDKPAQTGVAVEEQEPAVEEYTAAADVQAALDSLDNPVEAEQTGPFEPVMVPEQEAVQPAAKQTAESLDDVAANVSVALEGVAAETTEALNAVAAETSAKFEAIAAETGEPLKLVAEGTANEIELNAPEGHLSFIDDPSRPMEIPKKKKGFFSRIFG